MNDEKLMMKEFRRTYPQLKNDADPLYHPALKHSLTFGKWRLKLVKNKESKILRKYYLKKMI